MGYTSARLRDMAENLDRDMGPSEDDCQVLREAAFLLDSTKDMGSVLPFLARDQDALREGLHALDNTEMGRVIGVLLGVLVARGIDLTTFLPDMTATVLDNEDIAAGLRRLGKR